MSKDRDNWNLKDKDKRIDGSRKAYQVHSLLIVNFQIKYAIGFQLNLICLTLIAS